MKKITLTNCLFGLFLSLIFTPKTDAQLQNANWYFGQQAGLNFNEGTQTPTVLTNSAMTTNKGTASVSDADGNLLFYTNGITVWNKEHQTMPNGNSLNGSPFPNQSTVIVPNPNDVNKYYIITNSVRISEVTSGLYYSMVDMSSNNGLGDVDALEKNVLLSTNLGTKLTTIENTNDDSYWLVSFASSVNVASIDTFYAYKIDSTGINLTNQSTFIFSQNLSNTEGQMKISPDGTTLAMVNNTIISDNEFNEIQSLFIFNFDDVTGILSPNQSILSIGGDVLGYGVEFSPDSNLLYFSGASQLGRSNIRQINYKSNEMGNFPITIYSGPDPIYGLQAGIDGKIYAVTSSGNLGVINTPNVLGSGANYMHDVITLSPNTASKELPQFVPASISSPEDDICEELKLLGIPFEDFLTIKFESKKLYTAHLYNSSGTLVKVADNRGKKGKKVKKVLKINTSDLVADTYFLTVVEGETGGSCSKTIIKI